MPSILDLILSTIIRYDLTWIGTDKRLLCQFLCALPPYLRTAWAERIWDLLRPGGMLICLEFPLWKDPHLPGPPWGMKDVYWNLLSIQKQDSHRSGKNEDPLETRGKFHRVLHMRPEVSYKEGRGEDMLSLWERPPESFH